MPSQPQRSAPIAIIGLGCRYPDARNPRELWENVLARRQSFRPFPEERLPLQEYGDRDKTALDKTYVQRAAVIDGFEFDWASHRIPKQVFERTDITHWLALEVALQALNDAGYEAKHLPRDRTGVIIGNTLTGEQQRAHTLRGRWPFVRKTIRAAGAKRGLDAATLESLVAETERVYKSFFPAPNEDTLAGSLANTIAGRVCNYMDLRGGGYTVDGACSSSLLSVATAANALCAGDIDVALAGGVDVSLDAFELVGFARVGALSDSDMRVYDRAGNGFLPGEGCGFIVMKRLADARRDGDYVYATLNGWGISSDGKGGITAPTAGGQGLALRRAYDRAGYSAHQLDFVEGHGTGTAVGDPVELTAISNTIDSFGEVEPHRCGVTSFKSLVGHTKAAAGIGGLLKAIAGVNRRVIPPTAGCEKPHEVFSGKARNVYPVRTGTVRDPSSMLTAGVSAMGFGGINSHVTITSGDPPSEEIAPRLDERAMLASHQDSELFLLAGDDLSKLELRATELLDVVNGMSVGEMPDLARQLSQELDHGKASRAAIVASSPDRLSEHLQELTAALDGEPAAESPFITPNRSVMLTSGAAAPRVGFLFPGQGSQRLNMARTLVERFGWARELVASADSWLEEVGVEPVAPLIFRDTDQDPEGVRQKAWMHALTQTETAQPAICLASLLWLRFMKRLGIEPAAVGGHSLGELSAFHAAGVLSEKETLQIAALRGRAMASVGQKGTMASLACDLQTAEAIIDEVDGYVVIANINSPGQVAVSGDPDAISHVIDRAKAADIGAIALRVSGAFHSNHFEAAAESLRGSKLVAREVGPLRATLLSAVDGRVVSSEENLGEYFANQMLARVDFLSLTRAIAGQVDILIEVGPGTVLSRLVQSSVGKGAAPCLPLESKPGRDQDLNIAVGALFVHGGRVQTDALYESRLVRQFVPASERIFIQNPCEQPLDQPAAHIQSSSREESTILPPAGAKAIALARSLNDAPPLTAASTAPLRSALPHVDEDNPESMVVLKSDPRTILIDSIAERTGFPRETLTDDLRLLDDLNLDSIKAVGLISETASAVGAGEFDPSEYLNATLSEIVVALEERQTEAPEGQPVPLPAVPAQVPSGSSVVTRNFVMKWVERPQTNARASASNLRVLIVAQPDRTIVASTVKTQLRARGAVAEVSTIDALTRNSAADFDHFVVLLPRSPQTDDQTALLSWTRWLSTVAKALPTTPPAIGSSPLITFVRWEEDAEHAGYLAAAFDGFVATLHLERRQLRFRTILLENSEVDLVRVLECEFGRDAAFEQVRYDSNGARWAAQPEPQRVLKQPRVGGLSAGDVVLVTGGARGITAECALALAESTDARMVLIGSSPSPETAPDRKSSNQISATLRRFREKNLWCEYRQCDIRDGAQVQKLVEAVQREHGAVAGVIHGAAVNTPRRAHTVDTDDAFVEIAPKLLGALHLFNALDGDPPKIFIALTSIIGAVGMPNNAWYAFSNQSLDHSLGRFHEKHPQTEVLSIAYSVWDEIGMGADLGSLEHLEKMGVEAIPIEDGVARFVELVMMDPGVREVIVSAKLGGVDTWRPSAAPLPTANRFVDRITAFDAGVEITVRTRLTTERDPYLLDHDYKGELLFPTVFGLEAMGQVAACVTGRRDLDSNVIIEDIELTRPILVNRDRGLEVEIRARVVASDEEVDLVEVAIGCDQTGFGVDHFSARFVLGRDLEVERFEGARLDEPLGLDPKRHLYGDILFQGARFQRIDAVYELDAVHCVFTAEQNPSKEWILGDPYFRDALLQSVQICVVPDQCLPIRIGRLCIREGSRAPGSQRCLAFIEGTSEQVYETRVLAIGPDGFVRETLDDYHCKIVATVDAWPVASDLACLPVDGDETPPTKGQPSESGVGWSGGQFYRAAPGAGPEGQTVFIYRFPLAGQDSVNLGRTVNFSSYARWAGRTRELAVINTPKLHRKLYEMLGSNAFAGATNSFEASIFGYPGGTDLIETHFWIAERTPSDYVAHWRWWRLPYARETERELVATSRMRVSAVDIVGHGIIEVGAWPEFLDTSLVKMGPQMLPADVGTASKLRLSRGSLIRQESDGPRLGQLLMSRTFETSLRDSNLVGNLYFGNFASWQGHLRDVFMHGLIPEYYRGKGERGELLCTNYSLHYLREAMPFDQIEVRMYLGAVYESGVDFDFEYYRIEPDDSRTKLAIARHNAVWAARDAAGIYVPAPWPQAVSDALMGSVPRLRSAPR